MGVLRISEPLLMISPVPKPVLNSWKESTTDSEVLESMKRMALKNSLIRRFLITMLPPDIQNGLSHQLSRLDPPLPLPLIVPLTPQVHPLTPQVHPLTPQVHPSEADDDQ